LLAKDSGLCYNRECASKHGEEFILKMSGKLLAAALFLFLGVFMSASLYANEIGVNIGFRRVEFNSLGPTVVDDRTLVPIHEVFRALGFHIEWNPENRTTTLAGVGNIVVITVGSNIFTVNGQVHRLGVPAQIIGDNTKALPIRVVLETLGYHVGWNAATNTVHISPAPVSGIDHRPADNFQDFITEYAFLDWGVIVLEADGDTLWAMQFRTGNLMKSTDQGESWTMTHQFARPINAVYADGHGNLFVATTLDRWASPGTGEVFKSSDGGQTFRHVLDIRSGAPMRWNFASQNGTMFISEYGYKWLDNNARRIYRSLNFGETWTIVYEPPQALDYHKHKILITEDGIIYQSIGDGQNAQIIRSADGGYSWTRVVRGFQPTSGIVFDNHILWGLDGGPWMGVARYDRQTGEMTRALTLPEPFSGPAYDMVMAHGIVYAAFLSYGGYAFPASIWFSEDEGKSWYLLGAIHKAPQYGVGLNHMVTDGEFLYIDIGAPITRDGEVERFRGTLRINLLN
jgi:photosystem II stability/assembly factor-like uncharacterized protein